MDQQVIDLYDEFTHGDMSRAGFLGRLAGLVGGLPAAAATLTRLENDYARALVSPADGRILQEYVTYEGASGPVRAYWARPRLPGPLPAVVVIHENRGLNPHIEDVTRRAAAEGFWALAPDALSPLGGTPEDSNAARERMRELDPATTRADYVAGVAYAAEHEVTSGRVGCVGFCWGGAMANQLAVHSPVLSAAVAFYGRQPAAEEVASIQASLLLHYAGLDQRINAGIEAFREALDAAGKTYELHMYEGVNHAFHNDTATARYDEEAARLAWSRTIDFLRRHLAEEEA